MAGTTIVRMRRGRFNARARVAAQRNALAAEEYPMPAAGQFDAAELLITLSRSLDRDRSDDADMRDVVNAVLA
jgi:hypothetical protein